MNHEREILLDYHHTRGVNCTTTALANIVAHHGLSISEELCLGIGGGLGFTYFRGAGVPLYLIFGRSDDVEISFARAVGCGITLESQTSPELAWRDVVQELTTTGPVMLDVDVSKLHYPDKPKVSSWFDASHGGHKLVVTGWHPHTAETTVCDYLWNSPMRLPVESLWRAWRSDPGPAMATHNYWYRLLVPCEFVPLTEAIQEGIRLNLFRMRKPWNRFYGIAALRAFLTDVVDWRYVLRSERRARQAALAYAALETAGTGRGAFRRMYSRFLREAGALLAERELDSLSSFYADLARRWSELAELLRQAIEQPDRGLFSGAASNSTLTSELLADEEAGLARLAGVAGRWP